MAAFLDLLVLEGTVGLSSAPPQVAPAFADLLGDGSDVGAVESAGRCGALRPSCCAPAFRLPAGVPRRSAGHMALLRQQKATRKAQREQADFAGLADAWNGLVLRHGDQVTRSQASDAPRAHANQYALPAFLRLAFREVGRPSKRLTGSHCVQDSSRGAEILTSVASLFVLAQKEAVGSVSERWTNVRALHVGRYHDATPVLVRYGHMQQVLEPHGRYLTLQQRSDGSYRWKAVPLDEYRQQCPSGCTRSGVVELFAQTVSSSWVEHDEIQRRVLTIPPQFLQRGNASTIFEATEGVHAALSLNALASLADRGTVVVVSEPVDGCSANIRKRAAWAARASASPSLLSHSTDSCAVHKLNRMVTKTINEQSTIGDLHAVQYVLSLSSRRNALMLAVKSIIQEELLIVYEEPPAMFREHAQAVLEHTLLRTLRHVRGSVTDGWAPSDGRCATRHAAHARLLAFCNGDIRHKRFVHFEALVRGCVAPGRVARSAHADEQAGRCAIEVIASGRY